MSVSGQTDVLVITHLRVEQVLAGSGNDDTVARQADMLRCSKSAGPYVCGT